MLLFQTFLSFIISVLSFFFCEYITGKVDKLNKPVNDIYDGLFDYTKKINQWLHFNIFITKIILIINTLYYDIFGLYTFLHVIVNYPIIGYFGSLIAFVRIFFVWIIHLPIPKSIIWIKTNVPTLLVNYSAKTDLFFSGHTAFSTYIFLYWFNLGNNIYNSLLSFFFFIYTILMLIIMRVHYTMDIYAGFITAVAAFYVALQFIK